MQNPQDCVWSTIRILPHTFGCNDPAIGVIAAFVKIGRALPVRSPWWDSWVGGHAIQRCLLTGLIRYHFLVFEKDLAF